MTGTETISSRRGAGVSLVLCAAFLALLATSCGPNVNYIKRLQSLEEGVSSPTTIDELKDAIKKYEDRVEDIMAAETQTGIWWKILATRYMDNKMYGEALNAFQKAITYYPNNQNLYYYVGVCAANVAKSELDFAATGEHSKKQNYYKLSEDAYKRAVELEPKYSRALYGLSVLYVFELDRSAEAIPLLEKLLTFDTKHTEAMFVLARAYYMNYEFDLAVDMYDRIIQTSSSSQMKAEAEQNKKIVQSAQFGL